MSDEPLPPPPSPSSSPPAVGVVVALVVFVVALVAAAFVLTRAPSSPAASSPPAAVPGASSGSASSSPARTASVPLPSLAVVKSASDRTPVALAGPRKKPMLLHLWASWCGPCVEELPSLLAFGREGRFDVVAVSVDDRWPDVERFFRGRLPPEVYWDPQVTLEPALGVRSLPTTFLVDTQGNVRARLSGRQDWRDSSLRQELEQTLVAR